ncbi:MAG: glycosyltransferase [Nitrospinota bacterium]
MSDIVLVGNYLPRRCGIATFTTDLLTALADKAPKTRCWAVALNDRPEGYNYPDQVRFEISKNKIKEYHLAADFLNINPIDVVCLQHEYGIFGGENGSHVIEMLGDLRVPIVTTLHTVLHDPKPSQKEIIIKLGELSDRLVVMSCQAVEFLREIYGIPASKTVVIPHGIPDLPFTDPSFYKDKLGVEGRKVILTFGLLSPGKGIEYMIDALPDIISKHPEAVFIVLGATHPDIKKKSGEEYRISIQQRARKMGVEKHLMLHNRFVELPELCEFLGGSDIYVTPYLNEAQIVSGTLAYALGSGKAVVSTPYRYAREMLDEGRGRLVPFRDSMSLAAEITDLFENEAERNSMRKRAYTHCRKMVWKEVAREYLEVFKKVKEERKKKPLLIPTVKTRYISPQELPEINLKHLRLLTDDTGMLQHAKYIVPDRSHGYCTDDNARALITVVMGQDMLPENGSLYELTSRYLSFLDHDLNEKNGRFRNFMTFDRKWTEEYGSEDSHARAIWGLGVAVAMLKSEGQVKLALNLFKRALAALDGFQSPRAWAFSLVGIHAYLAHFSGDSETRRIRELLALKLFDLYTKNASPDWPWIENIVAYSNGRVPQALLLSGQWLQKGDLVEAGLRSLEWLIKIQTDPAGHFAPVGSDGWYVKNGRRARFDQQPVEVHAMIDACIEAYNVTGEKKWIENARLCFDWFPGKNDLSAPLYDYTTGGCRDGLGAEGANLNQGAESTLAWLLSLLKMYMATQVRSDSEYKR